MAAVIAVVQLASERAEIGAVEADYVVYTRVLAASTTSHVCDLSRALAYNAVTLRSHATLGGFDSGSCLSS